jgi:hypothetical protein
MKICWIHGQRFKWNLLKSGFILSCPNWIFKNLYLWIPYPYESMDSQYKSTGTRLPDTIPATLGFRPRWQNPWIAEGRVDHQQREQCLSQISAENNKHWIPSKRRQLFAQSILSVQIKILLELIRITLFQELVGPPGFTRILLSSMSLCLFVSLSLYLSQLTNHTSLSIRSKFLLRLKFI